MTVDSVLRLPHTGEIFALDQRLIDHGANHRSARLDRGPGQLKRQPLDPIYGACPERSRRKPFGKPCPNNNAYPYLFAGMEYDNGTGHYHTQARYYSPTLARFLSEDPLRYGAGVNFFSYAGNDPVNGKDPLGQVDVPGGDVNGPGGIPDLGGIGSDEGNDDDDGVPTATPTIIPRGRTIPFSAPDTMGPGCLQLVVNSVALLAVCWGSAVKQRVSAYPCSTRPTGRPAARDSSACRKPRLQ